MVDTNHNLSYSNGMDISPVQIRMTIGALGLTDIAAAKLIGVSRQTLKNVLISDMKEPQHESKLSSLKLIHDWVKEAMHSNGYQVPELNPLDNPE